MSAFLIDNIKIDNGAVSNTVTNEAINNKILMMKWLGEIILNKKRNLQWIFLVIIDFF